MQVMKTPALHGGKETGGEYDSFIMLQNMLFFISVILLVFVFKADLKRTQCDKKTRADQEIHDLLGGGEEDGKFFNVHRSRVTL